MMDEEYLRTFIDGLTYDQLQRLRELLNIQENAQQSATTGDLPGQTRMDFMPKEYIHG